MDSQYLKETVGGLNSRYLEGDSGGVRVKYISLLGL